MQSLSWQAGHGEVLSLSIDRAATRTAVITLGFLLAAHLIAANFFGSRKRLWWVTHVLVIFGFSLALLGIIQLVAGSSGYRLWIRPVQNGSGWLTGPFVNHNHFAGYMELLTPLPVGLLIADVEKHMRVLYGFAAVMMATAIILTASRGGIISLAGTLIFIMVLGVLWKNKMRASGEASQVHSRPHRRKEFKRILAG